MQLLNATGGTHCPYCAMQCAMRLVETDGRLEVAPRDFPTSQGGLCRKGWTAADLFEADRPLTPLLRDTRDAPLDPDFVGNGRILSDAEGRYGFFTIRPGAYPVPVPSTWWRPPHVHFSVLGPATLSRLVTQMYFPGDPLNPLDRILMSVPDAAARDRLVARPIPPAEVGLGWLGYSHDIVLRGRAATPVQP